MKAKYTLSLLALLWLAIVVGVLGAAGWNVQPEKGTTSRIFSTRDDTLTFSLAAWLAKYSSARELAK